MNENQNKFLKIIKHPVKFRMFLFSKLPSAYFAGVRLKSFDEHKAAVTVPYKWFSQNPFKSTYFACLAMAAEMSTGLLAMLNTYKSKPAVSMLVIGLEANYFKKAVDITTFTCEDGAAITDVVEDAVKSSEAKSIRAKSTGRNEMGELVAEFFITWSFKVKA
jgi:phage terminase large subunit-like protein